MVVGLSLVPHLYKLPYHTAKEMARSEGVDSSILILARLITWWQECR